MTRSSIVIPVHNKASLTQQCLSDLMSDPESSGAEIIVVDDASSDATAEVLSSFGPQVHVIHNDANLGFGEACNRGIEAASHELVILLNNDVKPTPGWLGVLTEYAAAHAEAGAVGAKLLFANDTVQHAGVVIGQDRNPYHLYAGFPADHPAVNRSRRFQVVTGACMLVRRSVFLALGRFDPAFHNGHEDVDLCLRLNKAGHEVHLCHSSVLYHLESASRDPSSAEARANGRLYRERWAGRVVPDDLGYYLEDGLLAVSYHGGYPIELEVSPMLAFVDGAGRRGERLEKLLRERSTQVFELLRESARLTVELGEAAGARLSPAAPGGALLPSAPGGRLSDQMEHCREFELDQELEAALWRLQIALAARLGSPAPSRWLAYRGQIQHLRNLICHLTPPGARVAVVSRGDERLIDLPERRGEHLPQDDTGSFAGFHPADGAAAVEILEALRSRGTEYLAIPASSRWWLDHYPELADHLHRVGTPLVPDESEALVYALDSKAAAEAGRGKAAAR